MMGRRIGVGYRVGMLASLPLSAMLSACCKPQPPGPPPPPRPPQCPDSAFPPFSGTLELGTGGCRPEGCGLNGAWLGQGVPFRELFLTPNKEHPRSHLSIIEFRSGDGAVMDLGFADGRADELVGRQNGVVVLQGKLLQGSTITLGRSVPQDAGEPRVVIQYRITIDKVGNESSWRCAERTDSACLQIPRYRFSAVNISDNCSVEMCRPNLNQNDPTLEGTAVIFHGDLYDDKTYKIRSRDFSGSDGLSLGETDLFNIACLGTAVAKLHLLEHTSASDPSAPPPAPGSNLSDGGAPVEPKTTIAQRQTLLRLLSADYCGNGHPFTEDGLPIAFGFEQSSDGMNSFNWNTLDSIDAKWDEGGATCLGVPRLQQRVSDLREIIQCRCGVPPERPVDPDRCMALQPNTSESPPERTNARVNDTCDTIDPAQTPPLEDVLHGQYAVSANLTVPGE
jgi:ADYC domain